MQALIRKTLMVGANKLVSTTKVQTFMEAVAGASANPTPLTRKEYEKALVTKEPHNTAAKMPLRNATASQMGGTSNRVQQAAKQIEAKQIQRQKQANPPRKAPNQISKEDLNKVSFGVQKKIIASQRANQGRMQAIPTNVRPTTTTTSSSSISKLQDMIQPSKKSMGSMIQPTKTKGKK